MLNWLRSIHKSNVHMDINTTDTHLYVYKRKDKHLKNVPPATDYIIVIFVELWRIMVKYLSEILNFVSFTEFKFP